MCESALKQSAELMGLRWHTSLLPLTSPSNTKLALLVSLMNEPAWQESALLEFRLVCLLFAQLIFISNSYTDRKAAALIQIPFSFDGVIMPENAAGTGLIKAPHLSPPRPQSAIYWCAK